MFFFLLRYIVILKFYSLLIILDSLSGGHLDLTASFWRGRSTLGEGHGDRYPDAPGKGHDNSGHW